MKQITRRSMLQGLATVPLVSALGPLEPSLAQARQPATDLCVWFHGLFTFAIMNDYIAVLTPKVEVHRYLAGLWKQEQKLRPGEWYRLSGVSDPARPNRLPPLTKTLVVSGAKAVNMAESFCLIRLPFPTQIIPLRYAPATFTGRAAPTQNASSTFPTVQIMRYRVVDYKNLRLEPFKPWVAQKRPPSIINFHIFAEPEWIVLPQHAMEAFDGMIRMFPGLDLKLTDSSDACIIPIDTNLPAGIDPQYQVSLAERNGECKKPHGTRTTDCFMMIIDTRI